MTSFREVPVFVPPLLPSRSNIIKAPRQSQRAEQAIQSSSCNPHQFHRFQSAVFLTGIFFDPGSVFRRTAVNYEVGLANQFKRHDPETKDLEILTMKCIALYTYN